MHKLSIKQLVVSHWRSLLLGTASVALSACSGGSQPPKASSSVAQPVSSVASSSVPSTVPSSSAMASSSDPIMSSVSSVSSVDRVSSSVAPSSATTSSAAPSYAWTIEKIDCDFDDGFSGDAMVLFDGSGNFDGNFFNKTFTTAEYANLSRPGNSADYTLTSSLVKDGTCGWDIQQGTWLKKIVHDNGMNQHSNGWSRLGFANGRTIGDIESIVLELRINSNLSNIPSKQDLLDTLVPTITADQVDQLDNGKFNLAITLGNPDASGSEIRAEAYLEIDQDFYRDEWVRITIPKDTLYFWKDANWQKTPVDAATAYLTTPTRIALNPETKGSGLAPTHGYTVRDFYGYSKWGNNPPNPKPQEDFKEMNISIRTFEIRFDTATMASSSSAPVVASSSMASSSAPAPSGPTDQARMAAGEALYSSPNSCALCHGANGDGESAQVVKKAINNAPDTATAYNQMLEIIKNGGGGGMPACKPVGDCAEQLTDYVWGALNMNTLPAAGGASSSGSGDSGGSGNAAGDFSENFDAVSGTTLPAGLAFEDCDNGGSSFNITGGALEVTSGSNCGGWVNLKALENRASAYVKFDATLVSGTQGNKWFMLVGNGDYTALKQESMRLRIFNNDLLVWNVGNFGDTLSPEIFSPGADATTSAYSVGDSSCFELFYDNDASVMRMWKDGVALTGLEMTGTRGPFQDRWYNSFSDNFTPDVRHVHLGWGGSQGATMRYDNITVSKTRVGCN